jgi:phage gp29-like protein
MELSPKTFSGAIRRLFSSKPPRQGHERARQLTAWQRAAARWPGAAPGGLPFDTYDAMQQDAMVHTVLNLKRLAVLAAGWRLEAPDSSAEASRRTGFVEEAFHRMQGSPLTVLESAMDAFAKGVSIQETVWRADGGRLWLAAVRPKDPAHFGYELDEFGNLEGLRLRLPGEAEQDLPPEKFVVYFYRRDYAHPRGTSDLDAAFPHWKAKQSLLNAWRVHLERYAMPTVLGKYERGLPEPEQQAMLAALRDLQDHTAVIHPKEIEVGLLGGSGAASQAFMEAIDHHNREIARAVVGQTLTTDEGRRVGSLTLGKVHLQVLLLQVNALRRELADSVLTEQVVRPLVEANFGPGPVPRAVLEPVPAEIFATGFEPSSAV